MIFKTLYVNGMIFTSNEEMPYAEAMSVSLGAIDYVGTTQGLMENLGLTGLYDPRISEFEVIDLKGRTVIPGFVDADIRSGLFDGEELAKLGITGLAASGEYWGKDMFYGYLNPNDMSHEPEGADENYIKVKEFPQMLSIYYPWEFIKANPEVLSDKQRMIRSRKVHVAGISLKGEQYTTEEMYKEALDYCKKNSLQLSVKISDDDPSITMLQLLMREDSWLEDLDVPCARVHRGDGDFVPFSSIKEDLIEEIEKANENAAGNNSDEEPFYGLDSMVIGYTKLAAEYAGLYGAGTLKVGNSATFLILDRDLSRIPVEELDQVKPEVTIINGKIAYKMEGSTFELKDQKASGLRLSEDLTPGNFSQ